jgi:hypothetical protein
MLAKINNFNLLDFEATLEDNGIASGMCFQWVLWVLAECWSLAANGELVTMMVRQGCDSVLLPIFQISIPAGRTSMKTVKLYSPFRAKISPSWWPISVSPLLFKFR